MLRAFILLLIPFAAAPQVAPRASKYSVSGQVVFDNGAPVARAEVGLAGSDFTEAADPVLTDAQGRFAFTGLPAGSFFLNAHRNDLGTFPWRPIPELGMVTILYLNDKFPHQDIVFRIVRYGTIEGTVRDQTGNPMPNVSVNASRRAWGNGKAAMQSSGGAATDDRGRFRIPSLQRGRYRVCVATQGSQPALPVGYATFGQKPREVYAESCLPAPGSKAFLDVAPGKKLDVDLVFSPQPAVEVTGHVNNLPANQSCTVQLQPVDTAEAGHSFLVQTLFPANNFLIANVPPGRYWASAQWFTNDNGVQKQLAARVPLTVGGSGVEGLELTLAPRPAIEVILHAPKNAGLITVGLRDAGEHFGGALDAQKQPDGTLRIALPHGGRYWLIARTELCVSEAHLGQADARDHAVEIAPGMQATLEVSFTDQCGTIVANVVDAAGKPVPNARNLILMSGTPEDPGDLFLATTDDSGSFIYSGMMPGKYLLWSWQEDDEWQGAVEDLAALKPSQTEVEIRAGQKITAAVPLLQRVPQGTR